MRCCSLPCCPIDPTCSPAALLPDLTVPLAPPTCSTRLQASRRMNSRTAMDIAKSLAASGRGTCSASAAAAVAQDGPDSGGGGGGH